MATKIKLMKLLQEMRGFSEFNRQHPAPRPSSLYLMQLRSHLAQTSYSRLRLAIKIDLKDSVTLPHPVKIKYVKPTLAAETPAPAWE
jgi:hypothetical protein